MTRNQHRLASALLAEQLAVAALRRATELHDEAMRELALAIEPEPGHELAPEHQTFVSECRAFTQSLLQAGLDAPELGNALHMLDRITSKQGVAA